MRGKIIKHSFSDNDGETEDTKRGATDSVRLISMTESQHKKGKRRPTGHRAATHFKQTTPFPLICIHPILVQFISIAIIIKLKNYSNHHPSSEPHSLSNIEENIKRKGLGSVILLHSASTCLPFPRSARPELAAFQLLAPSFSVQSA